MPYVTVQHSCGNIASIGQSRRLVAKSCVAVIRREELMCRERENKCIYAWGRIITYYDSIVFCVLGF